MTPQPETETTSKPWWYDEFNEKFPAKDGVSQDGIYDDRFVAFILKVERAATERAWRKAVEAVEDGKDARKIGNYCKCEKGSEIPCDYCRGVLMQLAISRAAINSAALADGAKG